MSMTPAQIIERDQRVQALWVNAPRITHEQMCALEREGLVRDYTHASGVLDPKDGHVPVILTDRNDAPFYLHTRDSDTLRARLG